MARKIRFKRIPSSLGAAIREDPDRFVSYLNINSIKKASDPYKEFKRQLRAKFGHTTSGLNMWKYLKGSYTLQNKLWKSKSIQKVLPKEFKGALRRKSYQTLLRTFINRPTKNPIKIIGGAIKKAIETKAYRRNGREVRAYARSKARSFTKDELDFLTRRLKESPTRVTELFNQTFKTGRTLSSIKTKLARIKKTK